MRLNNHDGDMDGILFPYLTLERTKRFSVVSIDPAYVRLTSLPVCDRYLVHLDLNCDYTSAVVRGALQRRQLWCKQTDDLLIDNLNSNEEADNAYPKAILQIADFENLRWEMVMRAGGKHRASSYLVRKGLSRKAQLSLQLRRYMSKHSNSTLRLAVPYTLVIDTWGAFEEMRLDFGGGTFANFDMNTLQAPLRERLKWCLEDVREAVQAPERSTWRWILKPSVTNKGADISLCADWDSVINALEDKPDIREWVLQRYIERPLLVGGHKFHLRVYVLAVGALRVFVFDQILMLLAAHRYEDSDLDDLYKHLTNTARSAEDVNFKEVSVCACMFLHTCATHSTNTPYVLIFLSI